LHVDKPNVKSEGAMVFLAGFSGRAIFLLIEKLSRGD
jgi:hypothetical protein